MTTTSNTNHPAGKYAPINGINLYYELHGTGEPLIMLHGGFGTSDMFAALSPTLAQNHQIIGVDLYGHGRTALTDRPFDNALQSGQIGPANKEHCPQSWIPAQTYLHKPTPCTT